MEKSALDHACEKYGCAKIVLDPKLHVFDDCFSGKIRMGDIDAIVERNGHILICEWKRGGIVDSFDIQHRAQIRLAQSFTRNSKKQTFCFIMGCPVSMEIARFRVMHSGQWMYPWHDEGTEKFKSFLRYWYAQADKGLTIEGIAA